MNKWPVCLFIILGLWFGGMAVATAQEISGVPGVVQGDLLVIDEQEVILWGVDAPELSQVCTSRTGQEYKCGNEARDQLKERIAGQAVSCRGVERDGLQRLLAVCEVGTAELNRYMIETGWAFAFTRYTDVYLDLQLEAKAKGIGLWQGEAEAPWAYRKRTWTVAQQQAPRGCPIKGNISYDRIYHTPWSPWYDRTHLNPDKCKEGYCETWFCSEREAREAGWRAPLRYTEF